MATSGDFLLATDGDFLMAMGIQTIMLLTSRRYADFPCFQCQLAGQQLELCFSAWWSRMP